MWAERSANEQSMNGRKGEVNIEEQRKTLRAISDFGKRLGPSECSEMFKVDGLLSAAFNRTVFDIDAFIGYCERNGMMDDESVEDFCERKYGSWVSERIRELFLLE